MKYLALYIVLILILYMILKLSCYKDQKNILYIENDINLNNPRNIESENKVEKFDVRAVPGGIDITSKYVLEKKHKFPVIGTPTDISLEKFTPLDIFNYKNYDYAKNDPDFMFIEPIKYSDNTINKSLHLSQNYTESNFIDSFSRFQNIPFLVDSHKITEEDRIQIEIENKYAPRIVESYDEVKKKTKAFGLVLSSTSKSAKKLQSTFRSIKFKSDIELPKQFNGIEIWKNYLSPITNQGNCGNCWAHASSSALADRFAILSLGKIKFNPSPYDLTVCSTDFQNTDIQKVWKNEIELQKMDRRLHKDRSCNGNNLYDTAVSLFTDGVTTVECFPNTFSVNGSIVDIGKIEDPSELPYCYKVTGIELDTCSDGKTPMRKYRCKTAYLACKDTERDDIKEKKIMYDLYKYGPMVVGMMLFPDFVYDYDGKTIYTHPGKSGGELGGHAVRLVGWGEETVNGQLIKYWWIANSWGTDWGINGYFRMKRGIKECQLEDNIMSVIPEFPGMTIDDPNLEAIESDKDKKIREFTGHYLDNLTGYYNTSIEKIKNCTLRGKIFPYIESQFVPNLPVYKEFFAGKVNEYKNSKNIDELPYVNDIPTYYCDKDYTPPPVTPQVVIQSSEQIPQLPQISQEKNTKDIETRKEEEKNKKDKESIFCNFTNSKYFDISYFLITLSLGFGLYYIINDTSEMPKITEIEKINELSNVKITNNSSFVPVQLLSQN
jgi:C1A family cysteine protease